MIKYLKSGKTAYYYRTLEHYERATALPLSHNRLMDHAEIVVDLESDTLLKKRVPYEIFLDHLLTPKEIYVQS